MKNAHSMITTLHPHYLEIIVMFRPLNMFSYKKKNFRGDLVM